MTTGLKIYGRTQIDNMKLNELLSSSDFRAEFNHMEGFFFIEAGIENYHDLEYELNELIGWDVSYSIEGIF